jgi:hypothetical protein
MLWILSSRQQGRVNAFGCDVDELLDDIIEMLIKKKCLRMKH